MKQILKPLAAMVSVMIVLSLGMFGAVYASGEAQTASSEVNQVQGNWVYIISGGEAAIQWGTGADKSWNVLMLPAELGGTQVTTLGGSGVALSNNDAHGYVLFPEGYTTIEENAVYDFNTTLGWSFPSTLSLLSERWCDSIKPNGVFYAAEDSLAAEYAVGHGNFPVSQNTTDFSAEAGEGGWMLPNGVYHLPVEMLEGVFSAEFTVVAESGYTIESLTVDGATVSEAGGQSEYVFTYDFTQDSDAITVTFVSDASAEIASEELNYTAPAILDGAVSPDTALPADVNEYVPTAGSETSRYENTMGVSTGSYYAMDGVFYEQIKAYTSDVEPMFFSKAEVINYAFSEDALVFGEDYSLIRLYNYNEFVQGGPRGGDDTHWYCAYLYRETEPADGLEAVVGSYIDTLNGISEINHDSLFVQANSSIELTDFHAKSYTAGQGPQEAGNFFGLASGIQIDGGDVATTADGNVNDGNTDLILIDPTIDGASNSIYAAANGRAWLYGGLIFSCSSGGHGPYVSTGGEIFINTQPGDGILTTDGTVIRDAELLAAAAEKIPDSSLAVMAREDPDAKEFSNENEMRGYRTDEGERDDSVTVIITGDEAGTALATDSGGGVIVANKVVTKSFGNGSGGVYSIGSDESWVYVYNSSLNSYLDAGLVSASGGYVFVYNCDISGVAGLKVRSGGSASAENTGIHVYSSRITAKYDDEEMRRVYDVSTPEQFWAIGDMDYWEAYAQEAMNNKAMNMFVLKAQMQVNSAGLHYWFEDKNLTPVTGNQFAVIYVDGASTPVYVNGSFLRNENYELYQDQGINNWLITAENAANGEVYFSHENSSTHWNVLDDTSETCELTGDIWIASEAASSDPGMSASGPAALSVYMTDSEWSGTVKGYGAGCAIYLDADSVWSVTEDCMVGVLEAADVSCINADHPVTVCFGSSDSISEGTIGNVTFIKI